MHETFDYVIVGAGSAGCVLAARLSEDADTRVLLLEAGGSNKHWTVEMPLGVGALLRSGRRNWLFRSQPEPALGGRSIEHPRGQMLGGCSSINGMVYSRGHALDYDAWASRHGCSGWSYADVLPYFRRSERYQGGENEYRGGSGPLPVTIPDLAANALNLAFIEAGREAGYPVSQDHNGFQQEGFGPNECTIEGGRRRDTASVFLKPALARSNLSVRTNTLATKVNVHAGRATGVTYVVAGQTRVATATREVILCAGAFGSPHLLMLSGIGPADHLREKGIEVVLDAPGVGRNLQDHPDLVLQLCCREPVSLYPESFGVRKLIVGADWFLRKQGVAASNQFHAAAFIRSRAGVEHPDVKLELLPIAVGEDMNPLPQHSFQVHMTMLRADSRGWIELASANANDKPLIRFNYLSDPRDIVVLRSALRLTREIISQKSMARFAGEEIAPGSRVRSDGEIDDWIRRSVATAYHPSCTCRMGGEDDAEAVLDPTLKLRGIEGLRVADASVMPVVTSSNTNAPTIMIAEKAADLVRGRSPPPKANVPVWSHPQWRLRQR